MLSFLRKTSVAAAIVAPVMLLAPTAQAGQTYVAATVGTGTITPGLTLTPTFQTSVKFTASLVIGVGSSGATIVATDCTFSGASSIAETDLVGKGSGTLGSCVGASVSGNVGYDRQGNVVTINGTISVNGESHTVGANVFVFVPTSAQPVQSYALAGTLALI